MLFRSIYVGEGRFVHAPSTGGTVRLDRLDGPRATRPPLGLKGRPMTATPHPILELRNVDTFYGPVQAHFGLSLQVGPGEIVSLLGGNASGKSTTMKIILGLVKPAAGDVLVDGTSTLKLKTPQIVRLGVGTVPEARRLFGAMSVRENLLMGAFLRDDRAGIAADLERVLALFPRVAQRLDQQAGTLSGGEQQMEIGRAHV